MEKMTARILVVDDEKDLVDLISYNLEKEGFETLKAYNGESALRLVQSQKPDLVILDLMLPGIQGMEVCKLIRKNPDISSLPIIMVTAKNDEFDKILGLEMGADDYITKPFSVRELLARVRAVLRRFQTAKEQEQKETFGFKGLLIDFASHIVSIDGINVDLSPTEFRILSFLTKRPGRVYTRDQILDNVWGNDAFVEQRTVDVHIKRLRSQLEKDASNPRYILTVRGVGYKFSDIV
ncbi:MAG TPA: response regulator [Desulfobacteraceae bacterium]|nr:response regulator [Desulfobacteraceae bacterium]HPJ66612.1 response regulator [Desulfobacteraceae bacterium]HPQ27878.1 response regulator [Desulfobacteraceae bacterium]